VEVQLTKDYLQLRQVLGHQVTLSAWSSVQVSVAKGLLLKVVVCRSLVKVQLLFKVLLGALVELMALLQARHSIQVAAVEAVELVALTALVALVSTELMAK
jgi:hypothetical protein